MNDLEDVWSDAAAQGTLLGPYVLVADDDSAMRELIGSTLGERGYQVTLVSSGTELCSALEETPRSAASP